MERKIKTKMWPDDDFTFLPTTDNLKPPLKFHSTMTPRGTEFFNNFTLQARQQNYLNNLKANTIRENNKYLAEHPEIRALIALFLRTILRKSSYITCVCEEAAKFFSRSRCDIEGEVKDYLKERGKKVNMKYEEFIIPDSVSASQISRQISKDFSINTHTDEYISPETTSSFSSIEESIPRNTEDIILSVLNFIINRATAPKDKIPIKDLIFEHEYVEDEQKYDTLDVMYGSTLDITSEYSDLYQSKVVKVVSYESITEISPKVDLDTLDDMSSITPISTSQPLDVSYETISEVHLEDVKIDSLPKVTPLTTSKEQSIKEDEYVEEIISKPAESIEEVITKPVENIEELITKPQEIKEELITTPEENVINIPEKKLTTPIIDETNNIVESTSEILMKTVNIKSVADVMKGETKEPPKHPIIKRSIIKSINKSR